jgi:hypothetical protein
MISQIYRSPSNIVSTPRKRTLIKGKGAKARVMEKKIQAMNIVNEALIMAAEEKNLINEEINIDMVVCIR